MTSLTAVRNIYQVLLLAVAVLRRETLRQAKDFARQRGADSEDHSSTVQAILRYKEYYERPNTHRNHFSATSQFFGGARSQCKRRSAMASSRDDVIGC